jgi:hypothetical protein
MTLLRYDLFARAVQAAATTVVRVASGRLARPYEESLASLREGCRQALGMELDTLSRFDAESVSRLFEGPEPLQALVLLVEERAALLEAHGRLEEARVEAVYAAQLAEASRRRFRASDARAVGRVRNMLAAELLRL